MANYDIAGFGTDFNIDAVSALMGMFLRQNLHYDPIADVSPTMETTPGLTLAWKDMSDLPVQVGVLDELTDPTPIVSTIGEQTLTINEHGAMSQSTARLRAGSLFPVDPLAAERIGRNAAESIDRLARNALVAGAQDWFIDDAVSVGTTAVTDIVTGKVIRQVVADLRSNLVQPRAGSKYYGYLHPNVAFDIKDETGEQGWRQPRNYQDLAAVADDVLGDFVGVRFLETPNTVVQVGAGEASADVYGTTIVGAEALVKRWAKSEGNGPMPSLRVAPVIDAFSRLHGMGWYWFGGYVGNLMNNSTIQPVTQIHSGTGVFT